MHSFIFKIFKILIEQAAFPCAFFHPPRHGLPVKNAPGQHKKSPFPGENSPSGKGRQLLFPLAKKGMTVYSLSSDKKAMTVILSTKSPPTIIMTRSKTRLSSP